MGYSLRPGLNCLLVSALAASACTPADQDEPANGGIDEPIVNLPIVPRPDPPLDRSGLLAAVAQAASRSAAGDADRAAQRKLEGRPFEVRIRFGCRGPTDELDEAWLGWSFNPERRRLRVRARPTIAKEEPLVAALAPGEYEAVEGFWIPRPWLLDPVCPPAAAVRPQPQAEQRDEEPAQPQSQARGDAARAEPQPAEVADPVPRWPRIGIAQFFTETDPRTGRRGGRPFESIKILKEDQPLGSQGFLLVLSGRLRALPGAQVIGCSSTGPDSPPECIVGAEFDRVWIEDPATRSVVAQWGSG